MTNEVMHDRKDCETPNCEICFPGGTAALEAALTADVVWAKQPTTTTTASATCILIKVDFKTKEVLFRTTIERSYV